MPREYRRYEPDQTLLFPPSLRDWLPEEHLAFFLSDTIDALENGREDAMLRVLEVKASAAETAREVLDTAMRVCGGQAFRKDVGVERRFRDTRASLVMAPTTDQLYDFIGKAVCGMPLF